MSLLNNNVIIYATVYVDLSDNKEYHNHIESDLRYNLGSNGFQIHNLKSSENSVQSQSYIL